MNKYIKNYILSVMNTVMMLVFPIITFPYVSRILGPTKLGIINFAQSYGYYFVQIASFGINSYAVREVSRVRNDKQASEKICNEIFNLNFFFSTMSTLLYFAGVLVVSQFRENIVIFAVYSFVILSNFLSLDWLLQSYDDYLFSTIRNTVIRLFSILAVFVFVRNENDYILYMAISCVAEMGTKVSTLLYSRKMYAKLFISKKFLNFKAHFQTMFTLFTFRLINGISSNLDKLMIGFMMAYANVGVYSAGVKFVLMVWPIVETVGVVLFPKINISADSSKEEYYKNLKINYDLILLMGIPMAVGLFLVSNRLIPLFAGKQYIDATFVSRILSVVVVLGPIGDMLGSKTLLVYKKDKQLLICSTIVAVSNVFLNIIMIPLWGINGAAIASLICYIIAIVVRFYFTRLIIPFQLFNINIFIYFAYTLPFIIGYILFWKKIDSSNIWMFSYIVVCVIVYIAELVLFKDPLTKIVIEKLFGRTKT